MKQKYYRSYHDVLQERFGCRVYKVSIDGGFTCPNRDGSKGVGGCIYCDETGSSSRTRSEKDSITDQILKNIAVRRQRYRASKFIAYFQSYTNTYDSVENLKGKYDEAISAHQDIVGLAISTRPDCVDEEKLVLIASYRQLVPYVHVEYGLQTVHNCTLQRLNRCETYEDFLRALSLTKDYQIEHCVHVILGLPGESREDQLFTADQLAEWRVQGVKIHLLVAMEKTLLAEQYAMGLWKPLDFEETISLACDFIERLHPECVIHRIAGNGHPLHLVAPSWMKTRTRKEEILEAIRREFIRRRTQQGSACRCL